MRGCMWTAPLAILVLVSRVPVPFRSTERRKARAAALRRVASFAALALSPVQAHRGGRLASPARQTHVARAFVGAKNELFRQSFVD